MNSLIFVIRVNLWLIFLGSDPCYARKSAANFFLYRRAPLQSAESFLC